MKKILIIIEQCMQIQQDRNSLINEYVNLKKDQGYQIDIIGDTSGVMRDLLDEKETSAKEMTGAQADVLFDLNRYENAIYVPANAKASQDILVYKPDDLDKNMIFYNIGNLNIVPKRALEKTREENLENLKGFVTPSGDYTDNIEKNYTPEGIVGDAYDKSKVETISEIQDVFAKSGEKIIENMETAHQAKKESVRLPGESSKEKDEFVPYPEKEPTEEALASTRQENIETLKGFVTDSGDYTDNIERNYTPEGIVGDAYDKPKEKLVSELSSVFNEPVEKVEEKMESAKQSSVDSIPAVSTTEKLTIGDVTDKKKIVL